MLLIRRCGAGSSWKGLRWRTWPSTWDPSIHDKGRDGDSTSAESGVPTWGMLATRRLEDGR
jgi:hypothetical protein